MLRLPQFEVESPDTVEGVITALQRRPGARLVAGGTNILPNLKHFLDTPPALVSLARVSALRGVVRDDAAGVLRIGAGVTLTQVAEHEELRALFPSLAQAAGLVATPLIRNMGTLGGNVNLDTRCRYVDQSEFWRGAIGGGCLKSEGDVCHVVPKGRNCVAAMSSDNVPALISLDARIVLVGPEGRRELALEGVLHGRRPRAHPGAPGRAYARLASAAADRAAAHEVHQVGGAQELRLPAAERGPARDLKADGPHAGIAGIKVVAGVLGAKPRTLSRLEGRARQAALGPGRGPDRQRGRLRPVQTAGERALRGGLPPRENGIRVYTRRGGPGARRRRGRRGARGRGLECARCCWPGRSTRRDR